MTSIDAPRVRRELAALASSWRQVLTEDPDNARPIVTSLLVGRVTISPTDIPKVWELRGQGTPAGLFSRFLPLGMASPPGFEDLCRATSHGVIEWQSRRSA